MISSLPLPRKADQAYYNSTWEESCVFWLPGFHLPETDGVDHEVPSKGLSVVSTVHFVKVFEISVLMTEQLAFKSTKRKDRAEEEVWLQNEKTEKTASLLATLWMSWVAGKAGAALWVPSSHQWHLNKWEDETHLNKLVAKTKNVEWVSRDCPILSDRPLAEQMIQSETAQDSILRTQARMIHDVTWGISIQGASCSPALTPGGQHSSRPSEAYKHHTTGLGLIALVLLIVPHWNKSQTSAFSIWVGCSAVRVPVPWSHWVVPLLISLHALYNTPTHTSYWNPDSKAPFHPCRNTLYKPPWGSLFHPTSRACQTPIIHRLNS